MCLHSHASNNEFGEEQIRANLVILSSPYPNFFIPPTFMAAAARACAARLLASKHNGLDGAGQHVCQGAKRHMFMILDRET